MKLAPSPTSLAASPPAPGIAPVATGLIIAAGFLLGVLPLLFVRGTQAWFSDAPAVWIYSVGFVIVVASAGIVAGEFATRRLPASVARWLQAILLLGAFATMPLLPVRGAINPAPVNAALDLLQLLVAECGLVAGALGFFLGGRLASDPSDHRGTPVLIGLMLGPVVFLMVLDPLLPTNRLDVYFSWSIAAFALAALVWLWQPAAPAAAGRGRAAKRPLWVAWVEAGLSGAIAALLLVVSMASMGNSVSTPKLWALPGLITVMAFSLGRFRPAFRRPVVIAVMQSLSAGALTAALYLSSTWPLALTLQVHYAGLATGVIALAATLGMLSEKYGDAGGMAGSLVGVAIATPFVTFVAQRLGTDTTEFALVVLAAAALVLIAQAKLAARKGPVLLGIAGLGLLIVALGFNFYGRNLNAVGRVRTFYGVTTAVGVGAGADAFLLMRSGDTPRAAQFRAEDARFEPTLFHGRNTGLGLLFRSLPKGNFRRIGIVGVGNGDLMAYAHPTDILRLYEFDPGPVRMASEAFTYLSYANTNVWQLVPGDPRLVLETAAPERFDVLILDIFSGAYLPSHLLTAEAFAVWRRQLAPDGVLAINLTNARFDLLPVVWRQAIELGLKFVPAFTEANPAAGIPATEWVFLTTNAEFLNRPGVKAAGEKETAEAARFPLWTDELHDPMGVLK